jgi:hypothetical protein
MATASWSPTGHCGAAERRGGSPLWSEARQVPVGSDSEASTFQYHVRVPPPVATELRTWRKVKTCQNRKWPALFNRPCRQPAGMRNASSIFLSLGFAPRHGRVPVDLAGDATATKAASSVRTRFRTLPYSRVSVCLNRRTVGYQGLCRDRAANASPERTARGPRSVGRELRRDELRWCPP